MLSASVSFIQSSRDSSYSTNVECDLILVVGLLILSTVDSLPPPTYYHNPVFTDVNGCLDLGTWYLTGLNKKNNHANCEAGV